RIEFPGAFYHVMARGNARLPIYEDDTDRKCFLALLETVADRFNFVFHAYCLMGNHYHLIVETPEANLSVGMRHLNGVYTQSFNRRHGRSGHVFQGRYKAILVDADEYLTQLSRYILLNPVRAKLVKAVEQYAWSSYGQTVGLTKGPYWLSVDPLLSRFGEDRHKAQAEFRRFVTQVVECEEFLRKFSGGFLLGSRRFKELISKKLQKSQKIKEIPASARYANRPPLNELVPTEGFSNKQERNRAIIKASREYGYSYTAIGKAFSLHYSSVSVIVKKI
ncbi:MAG: transposase, partial [Pseudodesulfovibrio sp.]|nr:transposase [Pseudodesulfovibrio sp.]